MKKMVFTDYTTLKAKELFKELAVDSNGLDRQEVQKRLIKYGPNRILAKEIGAWEVFLRQLSSPFIYLLLAAAALALVLKEYSNSAIIILFVAINTILGFYQEYQSEQTLKILKKHLACRTKVRREGVEIEVNNEELVPGDIVLIKPGDIAPADIRLIETEGLSVDESLLTGESVPVEKASFALKQKTDEIHRAKNIFFSGTTVVSGKGSGLVIDTGKQTAVGKITKLTVETARKSIFKKEIARFSKFVLRLALVTIGLMFLANLLVKGSQANLPELVLFSVALAVSVVPEALPVVTTFAFSKGALRLAKKHVVVTRLASVEDLGSIEVLCTDKTGTLTENRMVVDEVYPLKEKRVLFYAALGIPDVFGPKGPINPFDAAIWQKKPINQETLVEYAKVDNIPFDPGRRRDTSLVKTKSGWEIIVRGAPETIVGLCQLSTQEKNLMEKWVANKGKQGKRVFAIAKKNLVKKPTVLKKEETNLELIGLISLVDPIKETAKEAVQKAQKLGVAIKILTGDRKEIAQTVAEEIELSKTPEEIITGEELDKLKTEDRKQAIDRCKVFARVSPQQKYQIIQSLQENCEVGFLGEGINDAPALKLANIALVVQGATDVAREAADIVLLEKDLKVIIDGIKEGREIFVNTTKYIAATLSANFGNFYAIAAASLLINFLPMLPTQILLLNLLSDFPMIAMATDNVDSSDIRQPKKYNLKSIIYLVMVLGGISSVFDFLTFAVFSKWSAPILQTSWFMESILTELVFIFSIRVKPFFLKSKAPSLLLTALIIVAALATVGLPWSVFGQKTFNFSRPTGISLLIVFGIVAAYFAVTEAVKVFYFKTVAKERNNIID